MCKKIISNVDEDIRLKIKGKFNLVTDIIGWVPTFMQGLIGAITG